MRVLFTFLLTLLASGALADSIDIFVVDPQDAGVPHATVQLSRRDAGWRANIRVDGEGRYRFGLLTPGIYVVQAEASGFTRSAPQVVRLVESASASLELRLDLAVFEESVVVTSAGTTQTSGEVTKTVTVSRCEGIRSAQRVLHSRGASHRTRS